jgi:hypothetical protein
MWLMEHPLPIIFLGLIAVAGFIGGLLQTGRIALLYAAVAAFLLTVALLVTERFVVTPREQVVATLNIIAHDIAANDVEAVLGHISAGRQELRNEARAKMSLVEIHDVDIKRNLQIEFAKGKERDVAEASFNAVIRFSDHKGMFQRQIYPRFFTVLFARESDGQWRVRSYKMEGLTR